MSGAPFVPIVAPLMAEKSAPRDGAPEHVGVVLAHDDVRVLEALVQAVEEAPGLFVAGTSPQAAAFADVLVAGGEALERLRDERPARPVVALADGDAIRAARAALAAGAREILRWPEEREWLVPAIGRAARSVRPETPRPAGRLVAVLGASGGVGTTTLAAELASTLARTRDVLVLDLDAAGAGQANFQAGQPGRTMTDLAPVLDDPTPDALASALEPHASGARALFADPFGPAPSPAQARALGRAARALAAVTVADLGRGADPGALALAADADARVVVAATDVGSVRGARALLERLGAPAHLCVRRRRRASLGVRDVARALGARPIAVIADDPRTARAADAGRVRAGRVVRRMAVLLLEARA